jgi:hypothetical protein
MMEPEFFTDSGWANDPGHNNTGLRLRYEDHGKVREREASVDDVLAYPEAWAKFQEAL